MGRTKHGGIAILAVTLCSLTLITGCGAGGGGTTTPEIVNLGGPGQGNGNNPVGNPVCLQCHFSYPANYFTVGDPFDTRTYADAGDGIGSTYQKGVHNYNAAPDPTPQCETCHGSGGQHFGTGPIPRWAPNYQQCGQCHTGQSTDWATTAHSNPDGLPDKFFFQGSNGSAQATAPDGQLLFGADGKTPVTKSQRIEECSACHAYAQEARPKHIASGDIIDSPIVGCPSCHDSHAPALRDRTVIRSRPNTVPATLMLRLKPVKVQNDSTKARFGAKSESGTWVRPTLTYPFNQTTVANDPAFLNQTTPAVVAADILRLSSEKLCASCHTQGNWKYTAFKGTTAYATTHNGDVFSQYRQAGHSNVTGGGYSSWSLLSTGSRRPNYPVDNGKLPNPFPSKYDGTGAATNPTMVSNATLDGRVTGLGADTYTCRQCHHGVGTIDWLQGTQGGLDINKTTGAYEVNSTNPLSTEAHVIYGDSTTTCLSCHDPHSNGGLGVGQKNVRIPKYQSYNAIFNDLNNPGHGNRLGGLQGKMMDGTDIPANALGKPALLCLFCHQGRDSGYTSYRKYKAIGFDFLGTPATGQFIGTNNTWIANITAANPATNTPALITTNISISDEHHLSGGGTLWSKNSYEYPGHTYSNGIPEHQTKNCTGCHMSAVTDTVVTNTTKGGHTFKPSITTCTPCHQGIPDFLTVVAPHNIDGDLNTTTVKQKIGDYTLINGSVQPQPTDRGLFNLTRYALYLQNIELDGTTTYNKVWTVTFTPAVTINGTLTTTINGTAINGTNNVTTVANVGTARLAFGSVIVDALGVARPAVNGTIKPGTCVPNYNKTAFHVTPNRLVVFTANQIRALFNYASLQNLNQGDAVYVHNYYYVAQVLIDGLEGLGMTKNPATNITFVRPVTAPGGTTRPATDYSQIVIP